VGGNVRRPEVPWAMLSDAAVVLAMDEERFKEVSGRVFNESGKWEEVAGELGVKVLGRDEVKEVLRARNDCWH
jgi:hypothetical protein